MVSEEDVNLSLLCKGLKLNKNTLQNHSKLKTKRKWRLKTKTRRATNISECAIRLVSAKELESLENVSRGQCKKSKIRLQPRF